MQAQNVLVVQRQKSTYCPVSEQINKSDFFGQARIFELELGKVLADRNIPFSLVLSNQLTNSSRRECLSQGADMRECLRVK